MSLNENSIGQMLQNEISEAILHLNIEDKIKEYTGEEKNDILLMLKELFVLGNPRVWWLSLKYKPEIFVFEQEYKEIVNLFNKDEEAWFVVENVFDNDQLLYKTKISYIINIIGECSYFEYNIISENHDRFLCENDHGAFIYIDVNKNQLKSL